MEGNPNACVPTNLVKPDRCIAVECAVYPSDYNNEGCFEFNEDVYEEFFGDCMLIGPECTADDLIKSKGVGGDALRAKARCLPAIDQYFVCKGLATKKATKYTCKKIKKCN